MREKRRAVDEDRGFFYMQGSKEENVESARQISTLSLRRIAVTSKKIESTSRELLTCQNFNLKKIAKSTE